LTVASVPACANPSISRPLRAGMVSADVAVEMTHERRKLESMTGQRMRTRIHLESFSALHFGVSARRGLVDLDDLGTQHEPSSPGRRPTLSPAWSRHWKITAQDGDGALVAHPVEAAGTYLAQVRTAIEWLHPGGAHDSVLTIRSFGRRHRRLRCGGR